ncbi:hypothetical protein EMIT0324P_20770 [Pseudomonas chlororaphis]
MTAQVKPTSFRGAQRKSWTSTSSMLTAQHLSGMIDMCVKDRSVGIFDKVVNNYVSSDFYGGCQAV